MKIGPLVTSKNCGRLLVGDPAHRRPHHRALAYVLAEVCRRIHSNGPTYQPNVFRFPPSFLWLE